MAEYRHLGTPHPQWENFPHNLPPKTKIGRMVRDRLPITPQPGLEIIEFNVEARDGHQICVRSYQQSAEIDKKLPLLIYFHGGGFVTGGLETDDISCRRIAAEIPIVVLNVEYRLAPEYKFPIGFGDCLDVVRWAASPKSHATLPSIDLSLGFILGGTSAGANFTAGISHIVAQETDPALILSHRVTGILFLAGTTCHEDARPEKYRERILSIDELTNAPGLSKKAIQYFHEKYGAPATDARRSPLLFESHADLALRAVFYACGWDPRRDETLLFEEVLRGEGVKTLKYIYPGLPHGFWTTCPELDVSKQWEEDLLVGVRFLLDDSTD
ncbi:Alpha/Beta hydrolase protein [Aspergillus karnatakaensis]|uniref:alpha/beta hydrolase n=1 Tax=Aspergillus karnatakaensis TaxID=1810916 RepID=UPI003CCC9008